MERKIGEIFDINNEWYQVVKSSGECCKGCAFYEIRCKAKYADVGSCGTSREDWTQVIFKKLKKTGEPITVKNRTFQKLILDDYSCTDCVFNVQNKECCKNNYIDGLCPDDEIWVEIKQNKEDMKEKKDNYDGNMDKECIPLCDALNSLPDVETTESCCGHCKDRFRIFFKCKNPYSLSVIARVFNRRYSGTKLQWIIEVETHDNGGYDYFVHSVEAYENNTMMEKDISQLVENIKYWSSEKYKEHFIKGYIDTIKIEWRE